MEHGGSSARADGPAVIVALLVFVLPFIGLVVGFLLDGKVSKDVKTCLAGDYSPLGTRNKVRK